MILSALCIFERDQHVKGEASPSNEAREKAKDACSFLESDRGAVVSVCCRKIARCNKEKSHIDESKDENVHDIRWNGGHEKCEDKDRPDLQHNIRI